MKNCLHCKYADDEMRLYHIESCARALMTRNDFWDSVQEAGWILPAEIDALLEALELHKV